MSFHSFTESFGRPCDCTLPLPACNLALSRLTASDFTIAMYLLVRQSAQTRTPCIAMKQPILTLSCGTRTGGCQTISQTRGGSGLSVVDREFVRKRRATAQPVTDSLTGTGNHFAVAILKLLLAAVYANYSTEIIDDEGIEQREDFVSSPTGGKLFLRFRAL